MHASAADVGEFMDRRMESYSLPPVVRTRGLPRPHIAKGRGG